jgi:hypothetical protein
MKIMLINKLKEFNKETDMKWLRNIIDKIRLEIRYRKKLKELRKRDPFIYK